MQICVGENQNKTDRVTFESETDNRSCHQRQNARFDKKENWSSPSLSSLSFHSQCLSILDRKTGKERREEKHCPSITITGARKKERKELDTLFWKKWHMWNKDKMERTCVRACIYARVLMIIKFLATDPVVQHANITQLTVIKREEYRLIKSRPKPDVYEIRWVYKQGSD